LDEIFSHVKSPAAESSLPYYQSSEIHDLNQLSSLDKKQLLNIKSGEFLEGDYNDHHQYVL
jgi:hypothetical protein